MTARGIINIAQLKSNGGVAGITLYEFHQGQKLSLFHRPNTATFSNGTLILNEVTRKPDRRHARYRRWPTPKRRTRR